MEKKFQCEFACKSANSSFLDGFLAFIVAEIFSAVECFRRGYCKNIEHLEMTLKFQGPMQLNHLLRKTASFTNIQDPITWPVPPPSLQLLVLSVLQSSVMEYHPDYTLSGRGEKTRGIRNFPGLVPFTGEAHKFQACQIQSFLRVAFPEDT